MAKGVRDQTVKDSGASALKAACLQKSDIYRIIRIFKAQDVRTGRLLRTCSIHATINFLASQAKQKKKLITSYILTHTMQIASQPASLQL
jgi:hypothetical protein